MLTKTCAAEWTTKQSGDGPDVTARISTTSVDRDGDVLLPSGIRTEAFKRNPVVLLNHDKDRWLGKAINIRTNSNSVTADMAFAKRPETHPENAEWIPDTVKSLMQQGVLSAFSVGFIVRDGGVRMATDKDKERFGFEVRQVITDWELTEFSVVSVPANQDALAISVAKGIVPDGECVRRLGYQPRFRVPSKGSEVRRLMIPSPFRVDYS
jgi:HK97 family phage prohead protease